MEPKILIIPGLGGSGEEHWQSYWSRNLDNMVRIEQENWDAPEPDKWLKTLNDTLLEINQPVILVAHSLAVSLVAHWAASHTDPNIKGALLVAPADVDSPAHTPDSIRSFAPIPLSALPFPSIVVASEDDTFVSLERARYFAAQWGSEFVNIGSKGHINSASNLELWEEGQLILERLTLN
ncbi:alpha/beta hydrolase [Pedobacter lusitanus]|uniref:Alpha/beta hydrolase n=1 Tax=Pedobacter lusitanus TaxID=1503925 RepID=A0A0D0GK37_9SPHI|nr:alpha/beta hydrolase [Pedobacter lusitanus]KIO77617.1 alpha/beta hydrolase [Pedobacter lusitanus]